MKISGNPGAWVTHWVQKVYPTGLIPGELNGVMIGLPGARCCQSTWMSSPTEGISPHTGEALIPPGQPFPLSLQGPGGAA